jgi:hypothetical protein
MNRETIVTTFLPPHDHDHSNHVFSCCGPPQSFNHEASELLSNNVVGFERVVRSTLAGKPYKDVNFTNLLTKGLNMH